MILLDKLDSILPRWASALQHWNRLGTACAATIDALTDIAVDVVLAALPGQVDGLDRLGGFPSTDGLPLLCRDRRITAGLEQTPGGVAAMLRDWLGIHRRTGTPFGVLERLRGLLGPNPPRLRLVGDNGFWWTIEADGRKRQHTPAGQGVSFNARGVPGAPVTTPAHPWNWDGTSSPFRFWVIIYAPVPGLINGDEGRWGDGTTRWGDGGVWGLDVPHVELIEQLRAEVSAGMPAGERCPWIIVAFDPDSFDPETPGPYPAAGMPDGTWGRYGSVVGGAYRATRLNTARYIRGVL